MLQKSHIFVIIKVIFYKINMQCINTHFRNQLSTIVLEKDYTLDVEQRWLTFFLC